MLQINKYIFALTFLLFTSIHSKSQSTNCLKVENKIHCKLPEPSDVTLTSDNLNYLIASDHGMLYKMDLNGKVVSKALVSGADYEGICLWNNKIYVSEESFRKIMVYDETSLTFLYSYPLQWSGGRNQGFEAIARNEAKQCFVLISEKNPSVIFELDSTFNFIHEYPSPVSEISSACWHNGFLFVLSDEAHKVYQLNSMNYSIKDSWSIPVTNPEGIAFDGKGNMLIVSDDRSILFSFKSPVQ